jgi:glycerophosphoryl diester phosphodiesterase
MWVIGHRGAAGKWPENTLLSIQHAISYGVDWVEIDVRSIDGEIIVMHDDTLDRTTNGTGFIDAHSLASLRSFDAGRGERIPLLSEVMDAIDARVGLNIEIKQRGLNAELYALLVRYLAKQPAWKNHLMLSSFMTDVMRELSDTVPDGCLLGALTDADPIHTINLAARLKMYAANISLRQLSESAVQYAHQKGLKLLVYTVNESDDIELCKRIAVDGIFTDYPERAIAIIGR